MGICRVWKLPAGIKVIPTVATYRTALATLQPARDLGAALQRRGVHIVLTTALLTTDHADHIEMLRDEDGAFPRCAVLPQAVSEAGSVARASEKPKSSATGEREADTADPGPLSTGTSLYAVHSHCSLSEGSQEVMGDARSRDERVRCRDERGVRR